MLNHVTVTATAAVMRISPQYCRYHLGLETTEEEWCVWRRLRVTKTATMIVHMSRDPLAQHFRDNATFAEDMRSQAGDNDTDDMTDVHGEVTRRNIASNFLIQPQNPVAGDKISTRNSM